MNYLLDTSIVLDFGNRLNDLIGAGDKIFLTDIVLQELDGHKNDENKEKGYNAREFFRKMGNAANKEVKFETFEGDFATAYDIDGVEVIVIVRNRYKTRDINDSKIIEIAKDYGFTLLTRDMAQSVRAKAVKAEARVITEDFKFEVSEEKIQEMYDEIVKSPDIDSEIIEHFKIFCDACDKAEGFEENKKEFIVNVYKLYILNQDVKLKDGIFVRVSDKKKTFFNNIGSNFNNNVSSKNMGEDNDFFTNPSYSSIGGNIYHNAD